MKKNLRQFTQADVLAHMTENAGIRYQCNNLAKTFKVGAEAMRPVLLRLLGENKINSGTTGKYKFYYVPTEAEKEAYQRVHVPFIPKPLVGYEAMMRGIAAAAEQGRS